MNKGEFAKILQKVEKQDEVFSKKARFSGHFSHRFEILKQSDTPGHISTLVSDDLLITLR